MQNSIQEYKKVEEVYSNLVTKTPHRHAIALRTVLITSKQEMTGSDIMENG